MMDFLTVSIESKGMEEYLWGINLKSMQFIYIKMDDNIRKANFKLGDVLSFSEKYCGQNRHEFTVDGEINVEKRGRDALYNILEFKALYPIGLLEQTEQDRVLKIESVKDIIPGELIYMYVKVFGLAETYKVVLTDAKWIAYWKNKHFRYCIK